MRWAAEWSNVRSGSRIRYVKVGALRGGEEVTVTGEVGNEPWVRVELPDRKVGYIHENRMSARAAQPSRTPRVSGVYLTAEVSAGQRILPRHLQAVGAGRIPDEDIGGYSMVPVDVSPSRGRRACGSNGPTWPQVAPHEARAVPNSKGREGEGACCRRSPRADCSRRRNLVSARTGAGEHSPGGASHRRHGAGTRPTVSRDGQAVPRGGPQAAGAGPQAAGGGTDVARAEQAARGAGTHRRRGGDRTEWCANHDGETPVRCATAGEWPRHRGRPAWSDDDEGRSIHLQRDHELHSCPVDRPVRARPRSRHRQVA